MSRTANVVFNSHSWRRARQLLLVSFPLKIRSTPSDPIPTEKPDKAAYSLENQRTCFVDFPVSAVSRQASLPQFKELKTCHTWSPTEDLKEKPSRFDWCQVVCADRACPAASHCPAHLLPTSCSSCRWNSAANASFSVSWGNTHFICCSLSN